MAVLSEQDRRAGLQHASPEIISQSGIMVKTGVESESGGRGSIGGGDQGGPLRSLSSGGGKALGEEEGGMFVRKQTSQHGWNIGVGVELVGRSPVLQALKAMIKHLDFTLHVMLGHGRDFIREWGRGTLKQAAGGGQLEQAMELREVG